MFLHTAAACLSAFHFSIVPVSAAEVIQAVDESAKAEFVKAAMLHAKENNYGLSRDIAFSMTTHRFQ